MSESSSRIDPVCGMTGTLERNGRWFCSEGCASEFEKNPDRFLGRGKGSSLGRLLKEPIFWALAAVVLTLFSGRIWVSMEPVSHLLWGYLSRVGWAVALGLLLGGLIDYAIPKEYISRSLTGPRKRTIFTSAGLGFLASSCSHGCLALSMELYRKGASPSAVITFLLASPWASLSLTLLIVGLLGLKGLLIVGMALGVALVTGFVFQRLELRGILKPNPNTLSVPPGFSVWQDMQERWKSRRRGAVGWGEDFRGILRGAAALSRMVLVWISIGFILSAFLGAWVPENWWRFLGPTPGGLVATLGAATVMEVCSEGTAPLAVELFRRTGALGNAFAFLMGGVVTDVTELSLVWANLGRRVVFWMLAVTLPQVFLLGFLMNQMGR